MSELRFSGRFMVMRLTYSAGVSTRIVLLAFPALGAAHRGARPPLRCSAGYRPHGRFAHASPCALGSVGGCSWVAQTFVTRHKAQLRTAHPRILAPAVEGVNVGA